MKVRTPVGWLILDEDGAELDDVPLALSPVPLALLRELARSPGQTVSRAALLAAMPTASDPHAVEVAVARLRVGIGRAGVVETVIGRGYRLAVVEPTTEPTTGGGVHEDGGEPEGVREAGREPEPESEPEPENETEGQTEPEPGRPDTGGHVPG